MTNQQVQLRQQLRGACPMAFNGVDHTSVLATQYAVKAVGSLQIWVDDDGNRVDQPTPIARAAMEALSVAVGWLVVAPAVAQVVAAVRSQLKRMRDAQWERGSDPSSRTTADVPIIRNDRPLFNSGGHRIRPSVVGGGFVGHALPIGAVALGDLSIGRGPR